MNQISLALGHWGTGALAPDQTISRALRPNGSLDHQDSRRGPQVNISNLPLTDVRCFDPKTIGETHEITTKITKCQDLGFPMFPYFKNPMASIICRWKLGSRRCCTPAGWHLRLPALHRCKRGARQPVRFPAGDGIWLTVSLHAS